MSVAMSNKTAVQSKDPAYVNLPNKDMDDITNALSKKLTLGTSTEKSAQVSVFRQDRVEGKPGENDGKTPKVENDYVNLVGRAPVAGVLNSQFCAEQKVKWGSHPQGAQQVRQLPGQKRSTQNEQIYHSISTQDPMKVMKPAGIDHQRQQMLINNGFAPSTTREPVENDDRSGMYYNGATVDAVNSSNLYYNTHPRPQQLLAPTQKAPVSLPRTNALAPHQDTPYAHTEQSLPHLVDYRMNDMILNQQQYVNCQEAASQRYPSAANAYPAATSSFFQPDFQSSGYHSPNSMHSSSSQISPAQRSGQAASPFSQSGSPASHRGSTGSPMGLPSPQMHPGYAQSASPQSQVGSQSMFSPSQSSVYSPASVTHTLSASESAIVGSPRSQSVLSPYSAMSDLNSPTESSLYYPENPKPTFAPIQHENHPSLNADLEAISELEDIRNLQAEYERTSPPTANTQGGGPYYPVNGVSNVSTIPQASHTLLPAAAHPVSNTQSVGMQQPKPVHAMAPFNPTTAAGVTTSAANKIAIPALPKPAPPPAQPLVVLVVPQGSGPPPLRTIKPKPATDASAPQQPAAKPKGRGSRAAKNKAAEAKSAGQARPAVPDVKAETISAKAMISVESDEQLLRKTNGDTVLHQAILMRKQPVILAMLQAIQSRRGLAPLLNMRNDKGQTPLFLAVLTGQTWLTEALSLKMPVDCDLLCRYEVCEGQPEDLSALHYACKYGERCLREVKAMLASRSTTVDAPSRSGMTALHLALWNHGSMDGKTKKPVDSRGVVRALLDAGARCTLADTKTGKTALHFAVENGSLEMTKLIVESNSQLEVLIDQKNYDHRTALHFAVSLRTISEEEKIELVKYLMSKGASRNSKDKNKLTPRELVSPTQTRVLEFFSESSSPAHSYSDDDSYHSVLQSP